MTTTETKEKVPLSKRQKTTLIVAVILLVCLIAFAVQNYEKVQIELFMFNFNFRIVYLVILSFGVGVLSTYAFQRYRKVKKGK